MITFPRYRDWPIRWKVALLLLGTSLLPLAVTAFIEYRNERQEIIKGTTALLAARGDQVASQLDDFHRAYQQSTTRLSRLPEVVRYSAASSLEREKLSSSVRSIFDVWRGSDSNFRGIGILDPSGTVIVGTEKPLIGKNLAVYSHVQEALRGSRVISDLHIASPEVESIPTIAYLDPIKTSDGRVLAVVAMWVRATAMWKILEAANEKAGPGSFSVLFDRFGVRIGHSYSKDIIFHPGGTLDSATVDAMVAERRFGENTRALLTDPKSFPDQFDRARSPSVNRDLFRGFAPVNQQWNYGVPRRLETTPWTLFYMVPEQWLLVPVKDTLKRLLAVAGVAIIIALSIGMLLGRGLVGPIRALSETAESLSRGNLDRRVALNAGDELGRLGTSFNTMAERLEVMIESERRTSENLQKTVSEYADFANKIGGGDLTVRLDADTSSLTGQLGVALNNMVMKLSELATQTKETATILINTAVEISAVTTQVASAAAQAATAVNETTTTVEEVKQTAQVASQKAKNVLDSAQKATHVSEAGKKSVGDTIEGMSRIREQMELISESIVKLSEQSQAIGEIIATVNDLTDQSNLLAVNAAIEAAKAGEQGKGFAVVAQEIRSLAEQSKQATAQVKNILSDIQRATGGAVMATDQGSKVVESGMSQSTKAGEAIRALADSIVEAAQAATQIAASSQQQLVGTDQVALAMENIKQASTQNVAGTKQAETAAHNLHELGQKLKQLVEQYRV